ncbi:hypothetical protein ACO0K2_17035 [Undibacterium sp. MH2W]|uniref:hypothetical protein n=1 Tax=Undibacterium sp. MH2W TaxID=3413044 RepID=UPI003BF1D9F6
MLDKLFKPIGLLALLLCCVIGIFAVFEVFNIVSEQCKNGSACFELLKAIPTAIIAAIAAVIAYRQHMVAKSKLNFDLFERRYEIFKLSWTVLSSAASFKVDAESSRELSNSSPQAAFLFGEEIKEYIGLILKKEKEIADIGTRAIENNNVVEPEDIDNLSQLTAWMNHEAKIGCRQKFGKFLNFENWH